MATTIACTRKRKTVSCGIKLLENEAIEKTSVKGDFPQLATDIRAGASVYDVYVLKWTIWTAIGLLFLHFGALFVGLGSMRLEYYDILCNHAIVHVLLYVLAVQ